MSRKKVIEIAQEKGVRVYSNQETSMKKRRPQFGIIFRSSMSNKRVLSINPWFLNTKSNALCPCIYKHQDTHTLTITYKVNNIWMTVPKIQKITENVVGLGPFLLKSFSGYPSSGGTTILQMEEQAFRRTSYMWTMITQECQNWARRGIAPLPLQTRW